MYIFTVWNIYLLKCIFWSQTGREDDKISLHLTCACMKHDCMTRIPPLGLDYDSATNNWSSASECRSAAAHPSSSYCLRQPNDANSLENEQLCVLIDHTTSSTRLLLCVASSRVHQEFAHTGAARVPCVLCKVTSSEFGICRTDNQSEVLLQLSVSSEQGRHGVTNHFGMVGKNTTI